MPSEPNESGTEGDSKTSIKPGGEVAAPSKKARKRANPQPPLDLNMQVSSLLSHPRLQPEFQSRETTADADHRRKKEYLSFLVKELSPVIVGLLFIVAVGFYCFCELLHPAASQESQQRAWTGISVLLSGVVGFVFGKTAGK